MAPPYPEISPGTLEKTEGHSVQLWFPQESYLVVLRSISSGETNSLTKSSILFLMDWTFKKTLKKTVQYSI
jgi:hypothetical protein